LSCCCGEQRLGGGMARGGSCCDGAGVGELSWRGMVKDLRSCSCLLFLVTRFCLRNYRNASIQLDFPLPSSLFRDFWCGRVVWRR
jgi:hypothetical protein